MGQNASKLGQKSKFKLQCVLHVCHLKEKCPFLHIVQVVTCSGMSVLAATARSWGSVERLLVEECDVV